MRSEPTCGEAWADDHVSGWPILGTVNRRRSRIAAWWALLAVFLAQLATATYACPHFEEALRAPAPKAEMSTPCAGMGMERPADPSALCLEHCKVGLQLVDNQPPVDYVAAAPVLVFFVATPVIDISAREVPAEPFLARATAPPVFASSARLRI